MFASMTQHIFETFGSTSMIHGYGQEDI